MKTMLQPSDLKIAVIGYGGSFNMGKAHLTEAREAGMTPVAACDSDPKRMKIAAQEFPGISTFTSVKDLLKKSDANIVAIITPHNTHAKLALACLNAGRHVVCEKPFAITTAECDAMIAAAKRHKVVVSTYHNRHWDGCILNAVRKIKKEKAIGEVMRIRINMGHYGNPGDWWRSSKTISGGIMYDWGVHLLEYALQLIDGDMREISGFAHTGFWSRQNVWKKDTNEDEGHAIVRFNNGKWLSISISSLDAKPKDEWMEVTGTKGTFTMSHGQWSLFTTSNGISTVQNGHSPKSEGHKFYRNIADHLARGKKLVITPEWARRPIHIIDLAGQSARKNATIKAVYK